MAKNKFYAVKKGRKVGVFTSWTECEKQVKGYGGAIYKSFVTENDAFAYLGKRITKKKVKKKSSVVIESPTKVLSSIAMERVAITTEEEIDEYVFYVDGSYDKDNLIAGSGIVIIKNGELIDKLCYKSKDKRITKMHNVGAEINASINVIRYCLNNKVKKASIYYDYEGIEKWCSGEWSYNSEFIQAYKEYFHYALSYMELRFVKVKSHSGDFYNDMADELARYACVN